jgi:hypothetical protein
LAIKRRLLEEAVQADPDPALFEGWLLERCLSADDPNRQHDDPELSAPSGSVRAMALDVFAEWRLAQTSPGFRDWLDRGATSDDA